MHRSNQKKKREKPSAPLSLSLEYLVHTCQLLPRHPGPCLHLQTADLVAAPAKEDPDPAYGLDTLYRPDTPGRRGLPSPGPEASEHCICTNPPDVFRTPYGAADQARRYLVRCFLPTAWGARSD
jgi:hypothetical protein